MKKKYNKSFSVEISADMIADKLKDNLKSTLSQEKADRFIDCIVGPMCSNSDNHALKHLYYGLFNLDVAAPKFKDADDLYCTKKIYTYHPEKGKVVVGETPSVIWVEDYVEMGPCILIGFDTYRKSGQYNVVYKFIDRKGIEEKRSTWVEEDILMIAADVAVELEQASKETDEHLEQT